MTPLGYNFSTLRLMSSWVHKTANFYHWKQLPARRGKLSCRRVIWVSVTVWGRVECVGIYRHVHPPPCTGKPASAAGWGETMLLGRRAGISCPFMRQALLNTYCVPGADGAGSLGLVGKADTNKIKANRELDIAHGAVMA